MSPLGAILVAVILGFATPAKGLKCNEGFNMTVGGIPLYHWMERTCADNSRCFGQEMGVTVGIPVVMRYGACLSAAYADYLDCDNLFGEDSKFDPAMLLDMIPEITKRFNDTINDFASDALGQLKILLSNGQGTMEFIDGVFIFYESLGFNMEKALPLKQPLSNLLGDAFSGNETIILQRVGELFNAIANLDTANSEFTNAIYNVINNIDPSGTTTQSVKNDPIMRPVVERIPGLVRSMLPDSYSPSLWYDVTFKLLNKLNITMPKKTAEDMVAIIKSTYTIPDDLKQYSDPFFNRIPDLVDKLAQGRFDYAGNWSLNLLMDVSEVNDATTAFSDALITFLETITGQTLQYELKMTIKWIPGLFYKFFPSDKSKIEVAYNKMAEGLKTFDFTNITNTAQPTNLSSLLITLVERNTGSALDDFNRALIINFSRMFYNLLSDYQEQVESFFKTLHEGLKDWPTFNAGQLIRNLVVAMGGTVPAEIDPLLTHLQPVITEAMKPNFNVTALFGAMTTMIDAYKTAYPNSPFPGIMEKYVMYINDIIFFDWTQENAMVKYQELINEMNYLQIDVQFAIFNSFDYTTEEFIKIVIKAFPEYETYIELMQAMKPEDIKQLMRDITKWATNGPYTSEAFVEAIKPTVQKITASINDLLGEVRKIVHPDSCKYSSCNTDLCNTHIYIDNVQPVTKPTTTQSTSGAREHESANVLLNIAGLWMAYKAIMG